MNLERNDHVGKDEFRVAAFKIAQYGAASSRARYPHVRGGVGREGREGVLEHAGERPGLRVMSRELPEPAESVHSRSMTDRNADTTAGSNCVPL